MARVLALLAFLLGSGAGKAGPAIVESASDPRGPWERDAVAVVGELAPLWWRASVPVDPERAAAFYRLAVDEPVGSVVAVAVRATGDRIDVDFAGAPVAPEGMALIPAGTFRMGGDSWVTRERNERPAHELYVSAFAVDSCEVTLARWDEVSAWARDHGYAFESPGAGKGPLHPVVDLNWYDAVKWCNALSQREGLVPVYRTGAGDVYRSGRLDVSGADLVRGVDCYRLPTEAEWEKAARGGLDGARFPWGDTISHGRANYRSDGAVPCDVSLTRSYHPAYDTPQASNDGLARLAPVGSFAPNGYGLYDMAGNVWEWCWDAYDATWYSQPGATEPDPIGPDSGAYVFRGGSWLDDATWLRCANRLWPRALPRRTGCGFRIARSARELDARPPGNGQTSD